jgi:hypothetical protein
LDADGPKTLSDDVLDNEPQPFASAAIAETVLCRILRLRVVGLSWVAS